MTARIVEGTVRVHRFMANCEQPPIRRDARVFTGNIDRWHTTVYTPPGYCLFENGSKPAGSEDESLVKEARVVNLLTPETPTSTHYFWGFSRSHDLDDAQHSAYLQERVAIIFAQDKAVLEAQQRAP